MIEPWDEEMKIKLLWSMLLAVLISTPVLAQLDGHPGESVEIRTSSQTVFAYSTFGARLHDALTGESALPPDVPVALEAVDPPALANAKVNSTLAFRIAYGLKSHAHAGSLIEAKVIRVREGNLRARRGKTEPRVMEIEVCGLEESCRIPGYMKLRLESSTRSASNRTAKRLIALPLTAPLKVAI